MMLLGSLARENYDIVVIDKDQDLVEFVTDKYNVDGVTGSGASRETLLAAGASTADAIIALAQTDEVNMLACMRAKHLGTRYAAARVFQRDLIKEAESVKYEYNIDDIISPHLDAAEEFYENMGLPAFVKVGGSFSDNIRMYNLNVIENSLFDNRTVRDIQARSKNQARIACVLRNNRFYIPDDSFVINADDNLTILTVKGDHKEAMASLGVGRHKTKKIAIVGGGAISEFFLEKIENGRYTIDIFEADPDRCIYLMNKFPKTTIHYTDLETINVMDEKNVDAVDLLISASDKDEENLVVSMYAWSSKVPSVMTHIDNPEHLRFLHKVNIDITVSAAESSVLKCMRFLRNHESADSAQKIGTFYFAADGEAEIVELIAGKDFSKLDVPFGKSGLHLKTGVAVLTIIRGGVSVDIDEDTSITEGDRVVVAAKRKLHLRNLDEILAGHRGSAM